MCLFTVDICNKEKWDIPKTVCNFDVSKNFITLIRLCTEINYCNPSESKEKILKEVLNDYLYLIKSHEFINFFYWGTDFETSLLQSLDNELNLLNYNYDSNCIKIFDRCSNKNRCNRSIEYFPVSRKDRQLYIKENRYRKSILCPQCIKTKQENIQFLKTMPYNEYLKTEHWKNRREVALKIAGHKCQLCKSIEKLNVHHNTYENRGCEKDQDLIVLCSSCHAKFHKKVG